MLGVITDTMQKRLDDQISSIGNRINELKTSSAQQQAQASIPAGDGSVDTNVNDFYAKFKNQTGIRPQSGAKDFAGQCVSLVSKYLGENGVKMGAAGNAWDVYQNFGKNDLDSSKLQKISNANKGDVKSGDVFFLKPNTAGAGSVGHTGIIQSVNNDGTANILESNWNIKDATSSPIQTRKIPVNQIGGALRIKK